MRVFVTGATGFVGSAVVRELREAGHEVLGLARSDDKAAALAATGAEVRRGTLTDLDGLRAAAAEADAVVHTAYVHDDFADLTAAAATDRAAIGAFGEALEGSGKALVITAATGPVAPGRLATEEDAADPAFPRSASETAALALAGRGVRASVLRLPHSVHGEGDGHGFVPALIRLARSTGVSAYPGDGEGRWAAVHRFDAARLYRLAVEAAPTGVRLHAVGDEGVPLKVLAEVIGKHLGVPVRSVSDVPGHFGWLAHFAGPDAPASSVLTQKLLGWVPEGPGLVADLEAGHYFR
ncbi:MULTISPECIES: SDR family oxidoreductase [Amycolatopsis]|uniref:UDP-glucose 4-epimerase n=1 Tax=Amycolatopsis bullii TaxID=941987 RepID=A0ABQ3K4Z4_9PSEU|nr:SDR family oxidoreductase [Amycolatopsis bullii]GHF95567.1 UDP-glucose 4-epimerase [Amycolatopsis bullii]